MLKILTELYDDKITRTYFAVFAMHFMHQIEESISFFNWYVLNSNNIGSLAILGNTWAGISIKSPNVFVILTTMQLLFTFFLFLIFRKNKKYLKKITLIYVIGLDIFLAWHIISCYIIHNYAPIMVTCIMGLYLTPKWIININNDK